MTTSSSDSPRSRISQSSSDTTFAHGTLRWDISSLPPTTFATRMSSVITSDRRSGGTSHRSHNFPDSRGSAATLWLPPVTVIK